MNNSGIMIIVVSLFAVMFLSTSARAANGTICITNAFGEAVLANGTTYQCNMTEYNSSGYSYCQIHGNTGSSWPLYSNGTDMGWCCPNDYFASENCILMWPPRIGLQSEDVYGKKTLTVNDSWYLWKGITITANSIDARATPRQAWLTLSLNGIKMDDAIVKQGKYYLYYAHTFHGLIDVNIFGLYVDSIFSGATSDMIQIKHAYANSMWTDDIPCTESWQCSSWTNCLNNLQIRSCLDASNCGTTINITATNRTCCTENWQCGNWTVCANNAQTRNCTDSHLCETIFSKPLTTQNCTVQCTENWQCGSWSACSDNKQIRTCTDSNNCGTVLNKPIAQQSCVVQCTENWQCGNWTVCSIGQQTRECSDLNSCGTSVSKPSSVKGCTVTNDEPPVIQVTENVTADAGTKVVLNSVAVSAEGQVVEYVWTQLEGAKVVLNDDTSSSPSFTPTSPGKYVFSVFAVDEIGIHSDSKKVVVQIEAPEPASVSGGDSYISSLIIGIVVAAVLLIAWKFVLLGKHVK